MLTAREASEKAIYISINNAVERGAFMCFIESYIDNDIIDALKKKGYRVSPGPEGSSKGKKVLIKSIHW